jgi:hypothetical protein
MGWNFSRAINLAKVAMFVGWISNWGATKNRSGRYCIAKPSWAYSICPVSASIEIDLITYFARTAFEGTFLGLIWDEFRASPS